MLGGVDAVGLRLDAVREALKHPREALEVTGRDGSCGFEHFADVGAGVAG